MDLPVITVAGERVALGPLRRDLIPTYHRWRNDLAVVLPFGELPRPVTLEERLSWYERSTSSETNHVFTIYERPAMRPVGHTSLFDIDWPNRTATFGIMIGEADARGRGYGTETARLMLDYAFTALRLFSVGLDVDEYNVAGRRAYANAGFVEQGRRRARTLIGGRVYDLIYMDCLASEFPGPSVLAGLLPR